MADNVTSFISYAEGGLNTNRDVLSQGERQPGSAITLINYEPAITGGYRRISGFSNDYGTVPGTGSVLGLAVADGINNGILAARKPSSGHNYLHFWNGSGYSAVTTSGNPTMVGVTKVRFTKFNFAGPKVVLTDGINPAATYDGTTYTQITHAQAPDSPKFSTIFANHLFLAGDPTDNYNLHHSVTNNETNFAPSGSATTPGAGVINVGFPIVAIKAFRNQLYIFGTTNIKRLSGTDSTNFILEHVTDDLGCLATDSVVEIAGDLLFLSQDGLRPISGTNKIGDVNLESMTKNIQSIFTNIVFDIDLGGLSSVLIRQKSQVRFFFASADSQGIIGGFRENQQGGLNFEFGQLLGIEPTCADSGYIGQNEFVLHGESNGKVFRQEQGNSFGGNDIFSAFQTPFFYMGDPEKRKIFYDVSTYLRSEGDTELIMATEFDYGDSEVLSSTNYNLTIEKAAAFYNEATYNSTAVYDGNPSPVRKTSISGSGKSISFKYVTNGQTSSHSIQGLVITFGVGDRR